MRTWILLSTFALALPLAACGDDTTGSGGGGGGTSTTDAASTGDTTTTATTGGATGVTVTAGACAATPDAEVGNTGSTAFEPAAVTIPAGGTVQFNSTGVHTMTGDGWSTPDPGGQSCITFPTAGAYDFVCKYHAVMTGTVTVQ